MQPFCIIIKIDEIAQKKQEEIALPVSRTIILLIVDIVLLLIILS